MPTKQELRNQYREIRNQISRMNKLDFDEKIVGHILLNVQPDTNIAIYYPKGNEVDIVSLVTKLPDVNFLLPRINDDLLSFLKPEAFDQLVLNRKYGFMEPTEDSPEFIPDIIICPMLAFDKRKNRLGYGGGYYDKTISKLSVTGHQPKLIGVAYSVQEAAEIPSEYFDQKMNIIITEKGVVA